MRKLILLLFLIGFSNLIYAQWLNNANNYTTGQLAIGSSGTWAPITINSVSGANGNVGVSLAFDGTSYPEIGYRFKANGANYYQVLYNGSSINWKHYEGGSYVPKMVLTNSGSLGIGLNNPSHLLHVYGNHNQPLKIERNSNSGVWFDMKNLDGTWSVGTYQDSYRIYERDESEYRFTVASGGNVGIGTTNPSSKLEIKVATSETSQNLNFLDGNYKIGSIGHISSTDGIGISFSGYTESNVTSAQPTLVLSGYTKDLTPNNDYDAAVSVRGYNVDNNSNLQNLPIFKVMNGHNSAYLTVGANGFVGIGTTTPKSKLAVEGQIRATEVKVLADINSVPDYVFESDYELRTLKETKEYISEHKHLPEIPSASEIGENGIDLGDMNMRLLKKIEELTLYQIELLERLEKAEEKIQLLENK